MMGEYKISKILNNNVIICTNKDQEVVLIGKGIGFNKKQGLILDESASIEKVYKLDQDKHKEHYKTLVEMADDHVLQAVIESVNLITNATLDIDDKNLVVALTDHIIFAYKRLKQNQLISNPFAMETKYLYSDAYQLAAKVIERLNQQLDVQFPEDEIGFIALHIASNSEELSMREMSLINQLINKSITIIESDLNHQVDQSSVQYQRFIRHVQFLIRRLKQNEAIHAQNDFIEMIKKHYPQCYSTAFKILKLIQMEFDITINEAEVIYLTLHIHHFEAQINRD